MQSPPQEVSVFDFSFSRSKGKFRWRLDDQEWLCDAIVGHATVLGCDNDTGHMRIRCRALVGDDNTWFVYRE